MVTNITSLTGNGLKDWFIQRVTAVYFAIFTVYLAIFFMTHPHLTFDVWQELFHCVGFEIGAILALIAFVLHAWIGIWTVTTDYMKCTPIRVFVQIMVLAALLVQLIVGLMIVGGQ